MNEPGQGWPVGVYYTHVKVAVHLLLHALCFFKVELTRTSYAVNTCILYQELFSW